jgi:hypothetical protein
MQLETNHAVSINRQASTSLLSLPYRYLKTMLFFLITFTVILIFYSNVLNEGKGAKVLSAVIRHLNYTSFLSRFVNASAVATTMELCDNEIPFKLSKRI